MADKGMWEALRAFREGFRDGMREQPSGRIENAGARESARGALYLSEGDFLVKAVVLVLTHYAGMVSGAYAIFKEEGQLWFSLVYAVPWVFATILGGLIGGAVLWLITAALFDIRTRAAARVLVLTCACVIALYFYLYQFALSGDWTVAFRRQPTIVIVALAIAYLGTLPWTFRESPTRKEARDGLFSDAHRGSVEQGPPPAPTEAAKAPASDRVGGIVWIVALSIGGLIGLAFGKGMTQALMDYVWPKRTPAAQSAGAGRDLFYDNEVQKMAAALNAYAPRMLGNGVRFDGAQAGPGPLLTFHNTFVNLPSSQVNRAVVEALTSEMRQMACGDTKLRELFAHQVVVTYAYAGNDGVPVASISIYPSNCGF